MTDPNYEAGKADAPDVWNRRIVGTDNEKVAIRLYLAGLHDALDELRETHAAQ